MFRLFILTFGIFTFCFTHANAEVIIDKFEAKPASGESPLEVNLKCEAHSTNSEIVEFRWDFNGDGTIDEIDSRSTSSSTFVHSYKVGNHKPVCMVVDALGAQATTQFSSVFVYDCDGINGDYDGNGTLGLEDCIGILQELTK